MRVARRRFPDVVRFNRFELTVLFVPLVRALLFPFGILPPQFDESAVAGPVRMFAIVLLGLGAVIAYIGVLRQWPIVERAGLHLVTPLAIAYTVVLITADWHSALVSALTYLVIAAACWDRTLEITHTMRLANRLLDEQT